MQCQRTKLAFTVAINQYKLQLMPMHQGQQMRASVPINTSGLVLFGAGC